MVHRAGTNLALLSLGVAEYFPDEQSVNTTLRTLIHAAKGSRPRARWAGALATRKNKVKSRPPGRIPRLLFVELVPLFVGHPGDAQADQHGRSDQNQDSALERRNHAGASPGRLRIAERAILRANKPWHGQRGNQCGPACDDTCSLLHQLAHSLSAPGVSLPCAVRSIP